MKSYRWNVTELAIGYDAAAEQIHLYYVEIQEQLLALLPPAADRLFLLIDAGGGSGRLVEKFLDQFPQSRALLVDQSESFLALAEQRLERFGARAVCRRARLQDNWFAALDDPPAAIVSMSAIHHLDSDEKRLFYQRCYAALAPGGILLNGDEVRPESDEAYLEQCKTWAAHMHRIMDAQLVPQAMHEAMLGWEKRNVAHFGEPRASGDDCHETAAAQIQYLTASGFAPADVVWQKDLWAILRGVRPEE